MKRVLSILLVTILAFSAMSVIAVNAADATVTVGSATGNVGETVEVPVTFTDCPDLVTYNITVLYSSSDLNLTGITRNNDAYGTVSVNPAAANISMDADEDGNVNGQIVTLKFKILEGAKTSAVSIKVNMAQSVDWDTVEFTDYEIASVPGTITVETPGIPVDPDDNTDFKPDSGFFASNLELVGAQKKIKDSDVRFITAVSKDELANAEDYGYIFAQTNVAPANDKIKNFTFAKATKKFTCKDTICELAGDFGDPKKDTAYTYVTCVINNIKAGKTVTGRFYIKSKTGETYSYAVTAENVDGLVYSVA